MSQYKMSLYHNTPLLPRVFTDSAGNDSSAPTYMLKYEFLQPSGSFKSRGIGKLIYDTMNEIRKNSSKEPLVFASSGGNAGLAAAVASRQLGLKCTVAVPTTTNTRMIAKIEATGADVIVKGDFFHHTDLFLRNELIGRLDKSKFAPIYAPAFNHPLIWKGHSYIIDEILDSLKEKNIPLERVKGIVCSVGGGGLYNGIIIGLQSHGLASKIPVVTVETRGCHVLHASLQHGQNITFEKPTSVATSLCSPIVTEASVSYAQRYNSKPVVLDDIDVIETCLEFAADSGIITEPACGATLHLGYHPEILERELGPLSAEDIIVLIVCGGSSTSLSDLQNLKSKLSKAST